MNRQDAYRLAGLDSSTVSWASKSQSFHATCKYSRAGASLLQTRQPARRILRRRHTIVSLPYDKFLPPVNEYARCSLHGFTISLWSWGPEVGGNQEQIVGLRIHRHGLGAVFGLDLFHGGKFIRGILMENVQYSCTCRDEHQT